MLGWIARVAFGLVTASLLLAEIALTRVFSGTIGYYFAFMSISVAMLGLGAGSLLVTLRGPTNVPPAVRAGYATLGLGLSLALATLAYLSWYPWMTASAPAVVGEAILSPAHVLVFGALFVPFLLGGVVVSIVLEAAGTAFPTWYAVDLVSAAAGCVVAVSLLDRVPAPRALMCVALLASLGAPLFLWAAKRKRPALVVLATIVVTALLGTVSLRSSPLFDARMIRGQALPDLALDRWNDFSRVIVKPDGFFTWGLSETYPARHDQQFDLLIEGVAGTQIQRFDGDLSRLDFMKSDVMSLPHWVKPTGSTLVLGVGGGFDVLMARHFGKSPVVGVEVNPLVGHIVNEDFAWWSGRPYHLPDVTVHFENARTFVKRDRNQYDVVTVTWVDSGAATGAGAFALTENYLYTVEAFRDYLARTKPDGVLSFVRARWTPDYDAIKGIGIIVEALRQEGITDAEKHVVVTGVVSPHFFNRELTHVMVRKEPWTAQQIATVDEVRTRLHFKDMFTPGRDQGDPVITRLVRDPNRAAVFASFPFDMEPNTDDRPFYFFLREGQGRKAGYDVYVLRSSIGTLVTLILLFLVPPLVVLFRRGLRKGPAPLSTRIGLRVVELSVPTLYFALLGLGFMLVEMKLLQQSVLVVGNPTLSLSAVLSTLLLSTGVGALGVQRFLGGDMVTVRRRGLWVFLALAVVLLVALAGAERMAELLVGNVLWVRTMGLVLAIAPLGMLLGCPLPLGMRVLHLAREQGNTDASRATGSAAGADEGLVAWCWGVNGMLGVAGSAVASYLAIYYGLRAAFLLGVCCYVVAAVLFVVVSRLVGRMRKDQGSEVVSDEPALAMAANS